MKNIDIIEKINPKSNMQHADNTRAISRFYLQPNPQIYVTVTRDQLCPQITFLLSLKFNNFNYEMQLQPLLLYSI